MTQQTDIYIHGTAEIDANVEIGNGSKIWHFCHFLSGTKLGENCVVGQNVMIGPDVHIGDNCKIQNNVSLYKGITIERDVFIGPSAVFTNVQTPRAFIERKTEFKETLIMQGVSIGANATILCGIILGQFCLIGAGAVVTKNVKAHALMTGNPARQVGWVSVAGCVLGDDLICPYDGSSYKIAEGQLQRI